MFKGVYTAASGMIASERRQQQLSNNIANALTPGFKQDETTMRAFPEMLMQRIGGGQVNQQKGAIGNQTIGRLHTGVYAQEGIPLFTQGPLQMTGRAHDFAIVDQTLPLNPETNRKGHLFFTVQTGENDVRYTRNGQFAIDQDGFLVTSNGEYVLAHNGDNDALERIQLHNNNFEMTDDGRIFTNVGTPDEQQFQLRLAYTEEPNLLVKEGHGLLRWTGEEDGIQDVQNVALLNQLAEDNMYPYQVRQAHIEQSNVDTTRTMTEMLNMYRMYEANQRVLQAYDRSMERAANDIGRLF